MASSTKVTAIQGIGIKYNQTRISTGQEYASQATRTRTYFHYPHCSIPLLVVDLLIQGTSGGSAGSACAGNACWCHWRACVACWSAGHWSAASWGAACRIAGEAGAVQRCDGRTCPSTVVLLAHMLKVERAVVLVVVLVRLEVLVLELLVDLLVEGTSGGSAGSACAGNACWCDWRACVAC